MDNELKTLRTSLQQDVGRAIISSLVKRGDQFTITDFQQAVAALDYVQGSGDYTQRGGGNYTQGGGNYNQAPKVLQENLIDPMILIAQLVKVIAEQKVR